MTLMSAIKTIMSAIKTIISVSPNWRKVLKQFRQTEVAQVAIDSASLDCAVLFQVFLKVI